jgi:hypothetical protein
MRGRREKDLKRAAAVERMKRYTYKNSKAKRLGTADETRWAVRLADEIERLSA